MDGTASKVDTRCWVGVSWSPGRGRICGGAEGRSPTMTLLPFFLFFFFPLLLSHPASLVRGWATTPASDQQFAKIHKEWASQREGVVLSHITGCTVF